jgi:hypothetical protein
MNKSTLKVTIHKALLKFPHMRRNEDYLVATILRMELHDLNINIQDMSGAKLLEIVTSGKLSSIETIRKIYKKLQKENTELRPSKLIKTQKP